MQALETERVWTHQVPLESRSHMQNEVRSRTRQPQFPASQAKPGIQTLPTKSWMPTMCQAPCSAPSQAAAGRGGKAAPAWDPAHQL